GLAAASVFVAAAGSGFAATAGAGGTPLTAAGPDGAGSAFRVSAWVARVRSGSDFSTATGDAGGAAGSDLIVIGAGDRAALSGFAVGAGADGARASGFAGAAAAAGAAAGAG